jgi:hypothetical protein
MGGWVGAAGVDGRWSVSNIGGGISWVGDSVVSPSPRSSPVCCVGVRVACALGAGSVVGGGDARLLG